MVMIIYRSKAHNSNRTDIDKINLSGKFVSKQSLSKMSSDNPAFLFKFSDS